MNFRRAVRREDPEINFIPLIDLLLVILIFLMVSTTYSKFTELEVVILIFLMVSTTYSKFTELEVNLPTGGVDKPIQPPAEIVVAVGAEGRYLIDGAAAAYVSPNAFAQRLQQQARPLKEPIVVIHADAGATHQAVVNVLEAARLAGLPKVTFAAQSAGNK